METFDIKCFVDFSVFLVNLSKGIHSAKSIIVELLVIVSTGTIEKCMVFLVVLVGSIRFPLKALRDRCF